MADEEALRASRTTEAAGSQIEWEKIFTESHEMAVECIQTNNYGPKRMVEYFIPLLELSESPKIVNVSSSMGKLKGLKNESAKGIFSDVEKLTEKKIDEVLNEYLNDFKEGLLEAKGWPAYHNWPDAQRCYKRVWRYTCFLTFRCSCCTVVDKK